jgi:predicted GIY-YIG superfamily endonuclease
MTGVYLLHFVPRYKHAGHYLGYADDIQKRLYQHEYGQAQVALTDAASKAGVQFLLARTWEGAGRDDERKLKGYRNNRRTGSLARLCPICKADKSP